MKISTITINTLIIILCVSCQSSPSTGELYFTPVPTPATYEESINYMQSDSIDKRLEGLSAILRYPEKSAEVIPLVIKNLYYPYSSDVRDYAARILSIISISNIDPLPDLIYVMNNDDSINVRYECAKTLGNLGDLSAVPYLANNLISSEYQYNLAAQSAKSISKLTGVIFTDSSSSGYTLNKDGIPYIVLDALDWWENQGKYMQWPEVSSTKLNIPIVETKVNVNP